jgi:hypothetical protein
MLLAINGGLGQFALIHQHHTRAFCVALPAVPPFNIITDIRELRPFLFLRILYEYTYLYLYGTSNSF